MAVCLDTFYVMVRDMRRMQKEYFKTRSVAALQEAKRLERHVDDEVDEYITMNGL